MIRRAAIAVAVVALLLRTPNARGDEVSLVTVVRPVHAGGMVNEATMRLVAELNASGFRVRVVAPTAGSDGRGQVEGPNPADSSSFATIAILETEQGAVADVWVADHVTKKTLVRRVDVSDPTVANAASDLAVRSVELLRASLLEVNPQQSDLPADLARWIARPELTPTPPPVGPGASAPALAAHVAAKEPSPTTPPKSPEPKAPANPNARRTTVELSFGGLFATGGFGGSFGPVVRVGEALGRGFSVRASFAPGVTTAHLSAAHGSVSLSEQVARVDLVFTLDKMRVAPRFVLGGGFYHVDIRGVAAAPYSGEDHDVFAGFASAGAGLQAHLTTSFALVAELSALLATPNPTVTIAGTEAGSLGYLAVSASLGAEMGF